MAKPDNVSNLKQIVDFVSKMDTPGMKASSKVPLFVSGSVGTEQQAIDVDQYITDVTSELVSLGFNVIGPNHLLLDLPNQYKIKLTLVSTNDTVHSCAEISDC